MTLLRTLHDVLWCHKDVSAEKKISNMYKEEALISNDVLGQFLGAICVCNCFASRISGDRLNFATRTYIKRKFNSKMSKGTVQQI